MATCPACAEPIPSAVETCPHCGIQIQQYDTGPARGPGKGKTSGTMIALLIAGGGAVVLLVCAGIFAALLLPAVQSAREAARRSQCQNNLRQIGLALHNYHDANGCFPPAFLADETGRPMHSWRVLLLPYLGEDSVYSGYRFDEPWDGPNNSRLLPLIPNVYRCPSQAGLGAANTAYAGVYGPNSVFQGSAAIRLRDVLDGTSNSLAVGEAEGAGIPWMKPEDVDVALHPSLGDPAGFGTAHPGGCNFLMLDGSVRTLSLTLNPAVFKALVTINGSETVGEF